MTDNINVIIMGVNYFGRMASAQRVRNLFDPLLINTKFNVSNFIINDSEIDSTLSKVAIKRLNYNYRNIFSIGIYLFWGSLYLIRNYKKNANNVIYHYQYPSIEDIIFLKIAKFKGYKIIYDIVENIQHYNQDNSSLRIKFKNYTSRKLINQLSKNGSICFAISTNLVDYCKNICNNKIPVIHLPICVNAEYVGKFKNELNSNFAQDRIKVFYGGSFGLKDGFDYLLKGFELACKTNNAIDLILTGKVCKQMDGKVQSLITASKWNDRIYFLGCVSSNEYFTTMTNADILCMCRINSEFANYGFPFKLGEYLASGNAIIATNIGDVPLYITNKENALLIEPESTDQIRDAILLLAKDSKLRLKLGKSAKDTALKYFSSKKISTLFYECIQKL